MKATTVRFPKGLHDAMHRLIPDVYPNEAELVRDACWKLVQSYWGDALTQAKRRCMGK